MPRVFIVQDVPGKNFLPAKRYGELQVLLPSDSQIMFAAQPTVRLLRDKLRDATEDDYVLASGDPVAIAIVSCIVADVCGRKFNMIKWDRQNKDYYVVRVDLTGREVNPKEEPFSYERRKYQKGRGRRTA